MTRIFVIAILVLFSSNVGAECINDIKSEKDLVLSNICTYNHSALVTIDSVSMNGRYNPFAYLKDHRTYTLVGIVQEAFKGNLTGEICLTKWQEGNFDSVLDMRGHQYIVSINESDKCSVVDTGGIVLSTEILVEAARAYIIK